MGDRRTLLRSLPKVDRLLKSGSLAGAVARYGRERLAAAVRAVLDQLRERAREGEVEAEELTDEAVEAEVERWLARDARPYYRRVINGTGVVLHTGLGRAPLPAAAVEALGATAGRPQRVEIDLATGERGGRDLGCARLVEELVGSEAATVVNNNAAATLLTLATLARGRSVVVSRGELVEIGGSYRIPDVLRESGALLREVGTTNRTHPEDYRRAIDEEVGLLLKVHTSNYRVVGFTREVEIEELVEIGHEHGVPVVHDLGSGCLVDLAARGLPGERLVSRSVQAGADLVCFSGDKLLGGPQAGVIAGRREAVERCRRHPLFRTVRPGRLVYTALEATLRLYRNGDERAVRDVPALQAILRSGEELRARAEELAGRLADVAGLGVAVVECSSQAGSGSLPARDYPSWGVSLVSGAHSPDRLAEELRVGDPSILGRVWEGSLLLDVRTLEDDELPAIARRLRDLAGRER